MGPESGFKPMLFLTMSGICHGLCVAAIGLAPSANLPKGGNDAVEVAMNEAAAPAESAALPAAPAPTVAPAEVAAPAPAPTPAPIAKPIAKKSNSAKKQSPAKKIVMVEPAAPSEDEAIQQEIAAETPSTETNPAEETPAEIEGTKDVVATEAPQTEETVAVAPVVEPTAEPTPEATTNSNPEEATGTDAAAPTPEAVPADGLAGAAVGTSATAAAAAAPASEGAPSNTNGDASQAPADIEGTRNFQSLTQKAGNRAPEYPIEARAQSRQGNVELLYFVNKDGLVEQAKVATSSGHEDLDQAALNTISNYRFVPGQEGWTRHAVNFSLKGETALQPARLRTMGAQGR